MQLQTFLLLRMGHSFKVNVDGATFSELGAVRIGVLIRDAYGQVVAALSN